MNLGAIFVGLALVILVLPVVFDPFRRPSPARRSAARTPAADSHERALLALRDLEFDYQTDKITEADYRAIRAELLAQAARAIEARKKEEEILEEIIRKRRQRKKEAAICPQCEAALQESDRFCPSCGHARINPCPACGHENRTEDRFCSHCGQQLEQDGNNGEKHAH